MDDAGESPDPPLKGRKGRDSNEQYLWKDTTPSTLEAKRHVKRKTACDLDFNTLDCPICMEPLCPPAYQCQNGHITCAACCKKLTKGCPSCSMPIGSNRNIAVEKILESVQVGCKRADQGCQEMLKYSTKNKHEEDLCKYRPYHCPMPGCMYNGTKSMLPLHLETVHEADTFDVLKLKSFKMMPTKHYAILQDGEKLGLVHHEYWHFVGHIFFCTSFEASDMLYCLGVKSERCPHQYSPKLCNSLETVVHSNQGEEGSVCKIKERGEFLVVPQFYISLFQLNVTISPHVITL